MKQEIVIDAKGKPLGRLASAIAHALRGKGTVDFVPHAPTIPRVVVLNVDAIAISDKKLQANKLWRYSGYPSGRHETKWREVAKKDKRILLQSAVKGMLPKNRLQKEMMHSLVMYHGDRT